MVRVKANPKYMFKILTTLSAMVLLSIIMIMGFWAATIQTTTISSTISFTATDVDVNIVGVVTGSETPVATYTTNISDKEFDTVSKSWDLGQLLFSGTTKAPIVIGLAVRNNGIDTNPYITCEVVGDVPSNVKVRYSQIGGENAIPYSQVVSANEFSSALISSFQAESSQTAVGGISIPAYNPSSTNNLTTGKVFYYQIEFSIIDFNQAVDSFNLALGMTIQSNRLPERDSVYQVESKIDSSSPTEGGNCGYEVINSTSSSSTIKFVAEVEEGYEFDGWYIKDNSDNASDRISSDPVFITSTTADVTYYAKWKKARKVSFVVDGVNKGTTNYTSGTVSDFASAYEPSPYSTGWFLNEELTQVAKDDYLSTDTETSPITLYCRTASITGLKFTIIGDNSGYLVEAESATSITGDVVIPNKYEGKPVLGFYSGGNAYTSTFKRNSNITSVVIPNTIKSIPNYCFFNCPGLKTLNLPETITSIGTSAIYSCKALTSLTIPKNVSSMGVQAIYNCTSLENLKVDAENTTFDSRDNCNAIINTSANKLMFGCLNTEIPDTITAIQSYAFAGFAISQIFIPISVTTITVASVSEAPFAGCPSTVEIYCEASSKPSGWASYWNNYGGDLLTTYWGSAREALLYSDLTFTLNSDKTTYSVKAKNTSISGAVIIPSSINGKAVTTIASGGFIGCENLTKLFIPKSITTITNSGIASFVFSSCVNLSLYCEVDSKPTGWSDNWNYNKSPLYGTSICTTYWGQTLEDF